MFVVEWVVSLLTIYAVAGLLFAIVFVSAGVQRVDDVAEHAPIGFRLIIIPGTAVLWPWLLLRWLRVGGRK